jgi:tetraacyldisaccharide 4'-kinase
VQRLADLVLISADQWTPVIHLLPAGPWREPLRAVRRATLIIVTRKAAADDVVEAVHERLARVAPGVPRVSVRLDPGELVQTGDQPSTTPLDFLKGKPVRAILSIADPASFIRQMEARGVRVNASIFPDHYAFSADEVSKLTRGFDPSDIVVCTLKDAVKLGPHWPRLAPPLWYVSQQVMVERGVGGLERVLDDLVASRSPNSPTAG